MVVLNTRPVWSFYDVLPSIFNRINHIDQKKNLWYVWLCYTHGHAEKC